MAASEAAVNAVMKALGCQRDERGFRAGIPFGSPACSEHHRAMVIFGGTISGRVAPWTDRGCPVAVTAADAAVDADRASIQAETLREAADVINAGKPCLCCPAGDDDEWPAATMLHDRADRIEAQP